MKLFAGLYIITLIIGFGFFFELGRCLFRWMFGKEDK